MGVVFVTSVGFWENVHWVVFGDGLGRERQGYMASFLGSLTG